MADFSKAGDFKDPRFLARLKSKTDVSCNPLCSCFAERDGRGLILLGLENGEVLYTECDINFTPENSGAKSASGFGDCSSAYAGFPDATDA